LDQESATDPKATVLAGRYKILRTLGRALQLLGLMTTSGDVAAVRHTLKSSDARARSGAIEYLDNLLKGQVRKRVMVLIEEMPLDERIRKGNAIYGTRVRDVEDTLVQLIHDEDESIASAAMLLIEAHRLWSLAGDLEYVLSHRDVHDLHVFEASSWALAASRMPADRRRDLWQEALPSVELADRLRRMPLFTFTSVDELFRLARVGRQVRYETGHVLYERGAAPASFELVLDGQLEPVSAARCDANAVLWDVTPREVPRAVERLRLTTSPRNARSFLALDTLLKPQRVYRFLCRVQCLRASPLVPRPGSPTTNRGGLSLQDPDPCGGAALLAAPVDPEHAFLELRYRASSTPLHARR
jgi:hypothetical protein